METFFADNNITIKGLPFGLSEALKPTREDIDLVNTEFSELGFTLPEDYANFCIAHGGGTLGRVKIFTPYGNTLNALDLRFQTYRLKNKFEDPEFQILHSFPMKNLIVFAVDVIQHMWFGWCYGVEKHAGKILVFQEDSRGPPPSHIADTFTEFLEEVAIGDRMVEDQIERLLEPRESVGSDLERFEDRNDAPEDDDYHPPKEFLPFSRR